MDCRRRRCPPLLFMLLRWLLRLSLLQAEEAGQRDLERVKKEGGSKERLASRV